MYLLCVSYALVLLEYFNLFDQSQKALCDTLKPVSTSPLQIIPSNAVENFPKISDSSLNVLLDVYKDFNVSDFIEFVARRQQNRAAAEIVFKHKFLGEKYEIDGNLFRNGSIEETLDVLEFFGHLITKLKIDYEHIDANQSASLNRCLNECCSHSLLDIELLHCDDDKLTRLHGPFTKVENLKLQFGNLRSDSVEFEKIFPVVQHLDLGDMYFTSPGCFERHFSRLEDLTIEFWNGLYPHTWAVLEKRLQLNPQLKHVTLDSGNWNTLGMLSKYVPTLESLNLRQFYDASTLQGDNMILIRFENMKVLKIGRKNEFHGEKIPIVFGSLEEIECYAPIEQWIDVIESNKHLKKVTVGQLNDTQLLAIAEKLPNLKEFTTDYKAHHPIRPIVQYLEKSKHLKTALFKGIDSETREKIIKQTKEWKIVNGNYFVRD